MIPPKRFDIFPPLRDAQKVLVRCVHIYFLISTQTAYQFFRKFTVQQGAAAMNIFLFSTSPPKTYVQNIPKQWPCSKIKVRRGIEKYWFVIRYGPHTAYCGTRSELCAWEDCVVLTLRYILGLIGLDASDAFRLLALL